MKVAKEIIKFVDNLLKLNEQLQTTKLETQRTQIHHTIEHSERKIDELVYELYGLNEEEIKIIERT
jgi:adenine-specific DNA-methyltransferase